MNTLKKILSWLCLLPGIALTIYGPTLYFTTRVPDEIVMVDDCCYHEENEGKFVVMVGTLHYDTKASDPDFGVEFDSPAAKRTVSMYQTWRNGLDQLESGYSSYPHGTYQSQGFTHNNGEPPEGLSLGDEYLTVPLTMENGNLYIDAETTRYLCYDTVLFTQSYGDFMIEVDDLPETDNVYDFYSTGRYYMSRGTELDGSVRVFYSYLDFDQVKDHVFTVAGIQENGCIRQNAYTIFTDQPMTLEEIREEYAELPSGNSKTATVMGLIVLAIGLYGFFYFRGGITAFVSKKAKTGKEVTVSEKTKKNKKAKKRKK